MARIQDPSPVKYIAGLLIQKESDFQPVMEELKPLLGPADLVSPIIPFDFTDYYQKEMGSLFRVYVAFSELASPVRLAEIKIATNKIEDRWRKEDGGRRINIDPGYLSLFQLILASAKPFSHRICLADGIWAEVTLLFRNGSFEILPWTYPDYAAHISMFNEWKEHYRKQLQTWKTHRTGGSRNE